MSSSVSSIYSTIFSLIIFPILSGCATTQYAKPETLASKDSAKIYIERPSSLWCAPLPAPIYVNDKRIGYLNNGGKLIWNTQPGTVTVSTFKGILTFALEKNHTNTLTFNAQKNKTYHIKVIAPYQVALGLPGFDLETIQE